MYDRLDIRMYEVGFGDCFLVRFWQGEAPFTILFDCGSLTEDKAHLTKVAQHVIDSCTQGAAGPRIDLVVATHRHKDHVSGFSSPLWGKVTVGEVWMPWTEDPQDPKAGIIRNRQSSLALTLAGGVEEDNLLTRPLPASLAGQRKVAEQAMVMNALTNEKAMATLHSGFLGQPPRRFLPEPDTAFQKRSLQAAPGLVFHILGPSRSEAVIADMNPPDGAGYLAAPDLPTEAVAASAFPPRWQISAADFAKQARPDSFRDDDRKQIEALSEMPFGALAAALDNAVNNTSLILAIECGAMLLLFPGDAQWGSWNAILQDDAARALLARTSFYKVGHHGSHNATPKQFIESLMPPGGAALMSTGAVKQWPDIPRPPLVQALRDKVATWARSDDETQVQGARITVEPGLYIEWQTDLPGGA